MKKMRDEQLIEILKAGIVWDVKKWLIVSLAALVLLALAWNSVEISSAHGSYPTATRTPTITPTPTPMLQACQVRDNEIIFDKSQYMVGETIQLTVWVDHQGQPLVGANADVEVIRQPLSVQAIDLPEPLEDQSGSYVGDFIPELPGDYTFKITVNDPTGTRFLPCTVEGTVRVNPPPSCQMTLASDKSTYNSGEAINLTANVTVGGVCQPGAVVTGTVRGPNGGPGSPIDFGGSCPYTAVYPNTGEDGVYTFEGFARDPQGRFLACASPPITVTVTPTLKACEITPIQVTPDKTSYNVGEMVNFKVTVSNTNNLEANVTAVITRPGNVTESITLPAIGNMMYAADYTLALSGTYQIKATATGQNFRSCTTPEREVPVTSPATVTVKITPSLEIDLCDEIGDTSNKVVVEDVSNLTSVQLVLRYDPSVIQVIDANRNLPGVQIAFNPNLVPSENRVDPQNGRIFFSATFRSPMSGTFELITINWRPQRGPSSSSIIFEQVILRDESGPINATSQDGEIRYIVGPGCQLLAGRAILQGRADHSGVVITNSANRQTQTNPEGYFFIVAEGDLSLTFPGYLSGQADQQMGSQIQTPEGAVIELGGLDLLAGDVNDDGQIDILDLAYIAGHYQSNDPAADLNNDGLVDILDLAMVAGNYQQQGPLTGWQKE